MNEPLLKAPFPWFGGKSRVAHLVWERFGNVPNYVEPFAGSLAVMLRRPTRPRIETVNDLDCFIANFWRALKADPDLLAELADWPVNEADLHARHLWLVNREEFRERMKSDPEYFDMKIAAWWVWGISCWIGSGWCSKPEWGGRINGANAARGIHGYQENRRPSSTSNGVHRNRPRISGYADGGVHTRDPRNAGRQIWRKRPDLKRGGRGVARQLPDIAGESGAAGRGIHASACSGLTNWMRELAARLRRVRVCCGDWKRILGRSPTECVGVTAIFLDPPYSAARDSGIYASDSFVVAHEVREWAIAHGGNRRLRIALCGYTGEHAMPADWSCLAWKANGGHGNASNGRGRANAARERVWFSPHCLAPAQPEFFAEAAA